MRTRKVFRVYAALSATECADFARYLASPYFNESQRLIDFARVLHDLLWQQPAVDVTPEAVWNLLPDVTTDFRANGFDKLCAELLACLNDFLALQAFQNRPTSVATHQLEAYVAHALDEWVPSLFDSQFKQLGAALERDAEGLHAHLLLLRAYARHGFKVARMPDPTFFPRLDATLNHYFLSLKLEFATAVQSYNKGYDANVELPYLGWVGDVVDHFVEDLPLVVRAQALTWMLLQGQDTRYYHQLIEFLDQSADQLAADDSRALYLHALNYCIRQINQENDAFEQELDALYLRLLERGILLQHGKLPAGHFKNIVQLRLRRAETAWVAGFLSTWGDRILDDENGYALQYNLGVLKFHEAAYAVCLKEMEAVMRDYKADLHYGSDARVYSLMAIFELNKAADWSQEFEARLNAFRLFLLRDKRMNAVKKARQLNLIKQFRSLMHLYELVRPVPAAKLQKALQKLQDLKPAANRKWFEQQVRDLGTP